MELLSKEETNKLIKKAQAGNIKARNKIMLHNRGLVISIAKRYFCPMFEREDLINEGYIGMIEAIKRFDIDVKCAFSTYTTFWIKQKIVRFVQNNRSIIRLPVYMYEKLNRIRKEGLTQAEENSIRFTQKIQRAEKMLKTNSLDYLLSQDSDSGTLHDVTASEPINEEYTELYRMIDSLPKRTADIMCLKLHGFLLREIGEIYNLSRERVRQIHKKGLDLLKKRCKFGFPSY